MSRTGLVAALRAEGASLGLRRPRPDGLFELAGGDLLAVTGMGATAAARGARQLVAAGCTRLVSFGMAGGLDPQLAAGTVVLPARVRDEAGRVFECGAEWRRALATRLAAGPAGRGAAAAALVLAGDVSLLSVAAPLATIAGKAMAFARGNAAVDMESFAVAEVATAAGVPVLVVRVITDTASDALPSIVGAALDARGEANLPRLLAGLLRHPGQLPALLSLARRYSVALKALRGVAGRGLTAARL